jgi:predicted transglutaminase-like cysteine proteinase
MRWDHIFKAAIAALALMTPAPALAQSVFDGAVTGSNNFTMFPFWQKVMVDIGPVSSAPQTGLIQASFNSGTPAPQPQNDCSNERTCAPQVWLTFLDGIRGQAPLAQMEAVNQWANAKPYVEDWVNWHVSDYWETPGEFVAHGGDCEDYAITKYYSLIRLGFAPQDLRIVVVDDRGHHVFHAVLAARVNGTVWLLDNQMQHVVDMRTANQYVPIYSLNQQGWWMHNNPVINFGGVIIATAPQPATPQQPILAQATPQPQRVAASAPVAEPQPASTAVVNTTAPQPLQRVASAGP